MIDHEAEIFHSLNAIESLIDSMHAMQLRAERFSRTAEGIGPAGSPWTTYWGRSSRLLQDAMSILSGERAALMQTQIDAIELRRLNREATEYGEPKKEALSDSRN